MAPKVERQPARFMSGIFDAAGDPFEGGGGGGGAAKTVRLVMGAGAETPVDIVEGDAGNVLFIFGVCGGIILDAELSNEMPVGTEIEICHINNASQMTDAILQILGADSIVSGGTDSQTIRAGSTARIRKLMAHSTGLEIWSFAGGSPPLPPMNLVTDEGKVAKVVDAGGAPFVAWSTDEIE